MQTWKAILLVNLALVVGLGLGLLWSTREVRELQQELAAVRQALEVRQAAARSWTARGIVRGVVRKEQLIVLTHETIPGLMAGMTMAFEAEHPALLDGLAPGDEVRFTLAQKGERLWVVAIEGERR